MTRVLTRDLFAIANLLLLVLLRRDTERTVYQLYVCRATGNVFCRSIAAFRQVHQQTMVSQRTVSAVINTSTTLSCMIMSVQPGSAEAFETLSLCADDVCRWFLENELLVNPHTCRQKQFFLAHVLRAVRFQR